MAGIGVGYYLNPPPEGPSSHPITEGPDDERTQPPSRTDTEPTNPPLDEVPFDSPVEGRVAVVIDDVGWSNEATPVFSDVREHLTFAVLPGRPHSRTLYQRWETDSEFIVHMPMEPEGYPEDDPGEQALMTDMSEATVRKRLRGVLDRYPGVSGINNHMGSRFTQDTQRMGVVMAILRERELFYLDSRTSSASVALEIGRQWNVPVLRNQVFLDNERSERAIERQLKKLVKIAREDGQAIGIGHFQSMETARVLRRKIPEYRDRGIRFVGLSRILENEDPFNAPDDGMSEKKKYNRSDESRL